MPDNDLISQVHGFLAPIDPHGGFVRLAERLLTEAQDDSTVADALREVRDWLSGPLMDPDRLRVMFARREGTRADVRVIGAPPQISTLLAGAHMAAIEAIRGNRVDYAMVKKNLRRLPELRNQLDARFFEVLVAEVDGRALEDEEFASSLALSARQMDAEGRRLQRVPSPFITHHSPECCTARIGDAVVINNACLPADPVGFWICFGLWAVAVICCIVVILIIITSGGGDNGEPQNGPQSRPAKGSDADSPTA